MRITKSYLKDLVYRVNGAAIEVHKILGPGLLENVYHKCMAQELSLRGIAYESELFVPIGYKGIAVDTPLRCDLYVENILPVELKAVNTMLPVFDSQLLTYMRLLEVPKGLMINFNVSHIYTKGQKTFVNDLYRNLPEI